jgi:hypothetical protein
LTRADSQIIVELWCEVEMRLAGTTNRRSKTPPWRVFTCLVLVGLFFYNPFLGAGRLPGKVAVCHPASHRATVGASELEQFAQPNRGATALLPKVAHVQWLLLPVDLHDSLSRHSLEEMIVTPQMGFSASLWFRPPPTA